MSTTQYDATVIGGMRVDVSRVLIDYAQSGIPTVNVIQTGAVTMADGSVQWIPLPPNVSSTLTFQLDLVNNAATPIPEVDFTTGATLSTNTSLEQVLLGVLAIIRQQQNISNP
jgi:hypothetical protein